MGCSNCGREMCDCSPWEGSSMSQDYRGLPNDSSHLDTSFSISIRPQRGYVAMLHELKDNAKTGDVIQLAAKTVEYEGFNGAVESIFLKLRREHGSEKAIELMREKRKEILRICSR